MQLLRDRDEVPDEHKVEPFHRRSPLIGGQLVLDLAAGSLLVVKSRSRLGPAQR